VRAESYMKVRKHGDPGKILNCFRSTFAPTSYPKHGSWNKVEQSEQVVYIFFVAEKSTDLQTLNSGAPSGNVFNISPAPFC